MVLTPCHAKKPAIPTDSVRVNSSRISRGLLGILLTTRSMRMWPPATLYDIQAVNCPLKRINSSRPGGRR